MLTDPTVASAMSNRDLVRRVFGIFDPMDRAAIVNADWQPRPWPYHRLTQTVPAPRYTEVTYHPFVGCYCPIGLAIVRNLDRRSSMDSIDHILVSQYFGRQPELTNPTPTDAGRALVRSRIAPKPDLTAIAVFMHRWDKGSLTPDELRDELTAMDAPKETTH